MSGHTIELPLPTLKLKMVELWRSKIMTGEVPFDYELRMTSYCNRYKELTGTKCNTVGEIWELEKWYDKLTDEQKNAIRKELIIRAS